MVHNKLSENQICQDIRQDLLYLMNRNAPPLVSYSDSDIPPCSITMKFLNIRAYGEAYSTQSPQIRSRPTRNNEEKNAHTLKYVQKTYPFLLRYCNDGLKKDISVVVLESLPV